MFYNFQNLKVKYQLSYKQYTEFESLCYVNEVPVLLLFICVVLVYKFQMLLSFVDIIICPTNRM